jgi:hypothetical protein
MPNFPLPLSTIFAFATPPPGPGLVDKAGTSFLISSAVSVPTGYQPPPSEPAYTVRYLSLGSHATADVADAKKHNRVSPMTKIAPTVNLQNFISQPPLFVVNMPQANHTETNQSQGDCNKQKKTALVQLVDTHQHHATDNEDNHQPTI